MDSTQQETQQPPSAPLPGSQEKLNKPEPSNLFIQRQAAQAMLREIHLANLKSALSPTHTPTLCRRSEKYFVNYLRRRTTGTEAVVQLSQHQQQLEPERSNSSSFSSLDQGKSTCREFLIGKFA